MAKSPSITPPPIEFRLPERFGGVARADWVADEGYTVVRNNVITAEKLSVPNAQTALTQIRLGNYSQALQILDPL